MKITSVLRYSRYYIIIIIVSWVGFSLVYIQKILSHTDFFYLYPIDQFHMEHRPFLDAIRGTAIILVVLFHCNIIWFENGFIGVDIFCVLSGFLITLGLIKELEKTNSVDLWSFYARRAKRLLPSSILVLVTTSVIYVQLNSVLAAQSKLHLFCGTAFYIANWMFIWEEADYWGENTKTLPILHYWSLSVEEQFYLVYPILLLVLYYISRKDKLWLLLGLTTMLFAYSTLTELNNSIAHMSTWYRMYQFFLGATVSTLTILLQRQKLNVLSESKSNVTTAARVDRWIYLQNMFKHPWTQRSLLFILIMISTRAVTLSNKFQSIASSTVSGLVILHSEIVLKEQKLYKLEKFAQSMLGFVGSCSYGIYLFHWPIIIFSEKLKLLTTYGDLWNGVVRFLWVFSLSLFLGFFNRFLIEVPIAKKNCSTKTQQKMIVLSSFLAPFLLCMIFKYIIFSSDRLIMIPMQYHSESIVKNSTIIISNSSLKSNTSYLTSSSDMAISPQPCFALHGSCQDGQRIKRVPDSELYAYPDLSIFPASSLSRPIIAIVGDSIALMFRRAAFQISKDYDINVVFYKKSGCANIKYSYFSPDKRHCNWDNRVELCTAVEKYKPSIILIFSSSIFWGMELRLPHSNDILASGHIKYNETYVYYRKLFIEELKNHHTEAIIVAIAPIIVFDEEYWSCLGLANTCSSCDQPLSNCLRSMADLPFLQQSLAAIPSKIVDINSIMCPCNICPAIYDDQSVMADHLHPNPYYFYAIRKSFVDILEQEKIFIKNGSAIL